MGRAMVVGGARASAPATGIRVGDLAVGSTVKLMENGVAVEYLVVNQGKPSGSSLYDDSCDGTWLLRKDIYVTRQWHSSNVNDYANSTIHSYLNADFFNLFGTKEKAAIKQVKIPYRAGRGWSTTVTSGSNGLSARIFLLSMPEIGYIDSFSYEKAMDGAETTYFMDCVDSNSSTESKRVANLNGSSARWWLRSPHCDSTDPNTKSFLVSAAGLASGYNCSNSYGVRPALVLPFGALFDEETMLFNGKVAA